VLFTEFGTSYAISVSSLNLKKARVMKTLNLIFSIALLALATTAFSLGAFLVKFSRAEKESSMEPVVSMSFTMDQPDVVYEEAYTTESWMTSPFNCNVSEADLPIESWMTAPFEAAESIEVESWMTSAWL
jgi:hypothetical protein